MQMVQSVLIKDLVINAFAKWDLQDKIVKMVRAALMKFLCSLLCHFFISFYYFYNLLIFSVKALPFSF